MKIISGGQTGVDRAALDVALELGLQCGGFCPKRRRAEDGSISKRYPLVETKEYSYHTRTRKNIEEADATLVITRGLPTTGTLLTIILAAKLGKPAFLVNPSRGLEQLTQRIQIWIDNGGFQVINIAGPRLSKDPEIYKLAYDLIKRIFAIYKNKLNKKQASDLF